MRVTAIPAQVTTVEDRITGSLNLTQLVLLCVPVFAGGLLFGLFPPVMHSAPYKVVLIVMMGVLCGACAVRVKGTIVLLWVGVLLRYWLRPRYYVFNKRSIHGREQYRAPTEPPDTNADEGSKRTRTQLLLSLEDLVRVQEFIENPATNLAFETRKGGLYVRITEAKQKS